MWHWMWPWKTYQSEDADVVSRLLPSLWDLSPGESFEIPATKSMEGKFNTHTRVRSTSKYCSTSFYLPSLHSLLFVSSVICHSLETSFFFFFFPLSLFLLPRLWIHWTVQNTRLRLFHFFTSYYPGPTSSCTPSSSPWPSHHHPESSPLPSLRLTIVRWCGADSHHTFPPWCWWICLLPTIVIALPRHSISLLLETWHPSSIRPLRLQNQQSQDTKTAAYHYHPPDSLRPHQVNTRQITITIAMIRRAGIFNREKMGPAMLL